VDAKFSKKSQKSAMHHAMAYQNKFNKALEYMGLKKEFSDSHSELVKNTYVLTTALENNILTIVADRKSVKNVIYSPKIDTNKTMTQDMISTAIATVIAFINPYMIKEGRDEIIKKLGLDNNTEPNKQQEHAFDIDKYHVSSKVIPQVGYTIKIDALKKKRKKKTIDSSDSCRAFLFVDPISYKASKLAEESVIKYSKKYAQEQYAKLEIYDEETLKMIAKDNINAFKNLIQVGDKKLLQKVIDKYCAIDMCSYEDLDNMYKEELEKSKQ
jgi:hypothetical protein